MCRNIKFIKYEKPCSQNHSFSKNTIIIGRYNYNNTY